jgi:hypothetical protein
VANFLKDIDTLSALLSESSSARPSTASAPKRQTDFPLGFFTTDVIAHLNLHLLKERGKRSFLHALLAAEGLIWRSSE